MDEVVKPQYRPTQVLPQKLKVEVDVPMSLFLVATYILWRVVKNEVSKSRSK